MTITTIKLRNNSSKVYNGIKPGQTVNVENPTLYLVNGFATVDIQTEEAPKAKKKKQTKEVYENENKEAENTPDADLLNELD